MNQPAMTMGFKPVAVTRQPVYSTSGKKMGYMQFDGWACDQSGRRVARIVRYKNNAAPWASSGACGSTIVGRTW